MIILTGPFLFIPLTSALTTSRSREPQAGHYLTASLGAPCLSPNNWGQIQHNNPTHCAHQPAKNNVSSSGWSTKQCYDSQQDDTWKERDVDPTPTPRRCIDPAPGQLGRTEPRLEKWLVISHTGGPSLIWDMSGFKAVVCVVKSCCLQHLQVKHHSRVPYIS